MSVINGQLANQTTFNNAFMSRTAATTSTVAKMALSNTDPESGALIVNTQRAINKLFEGVGISGEADANVNNYASENYIADGDSRKVAIEKLDAQLKATQDDLDDHKTNVNAHPQYLTEPEADLLYDTLGSAQAVADSLSNVTNDAQLKRAAGDFNSFTEKATGEDDDIVLIEDSADSFNKKKMKLSQVLGGGSGSGQINFLTNPDGLTGTTGWTEGSFAAASRPSGTFTPSSGAGAFAISSTSTTPLGVGTTSLLLTKSSGASRQGRAVVSDFVLPIDYRAKVLSIDINYIINSGTFVAGSNSADSSLIWYCAFSNDNGATYTVVEPSSFKLLSNSTTISDRFRASIQTPYDATNMRLIAYVAETANSAWVVECIASVSPSEYVYGTPITDWQTFTPSLTNGGTTSTNVGKWRRVGDSIEMQTLQIFSGAGPAGGFANSPPSGIIFDTSKINSLNNIGVAAWYDASAGQERAGVALVTSLTLVGVLIDSNGSATLQGSALASGDYVRIAVTLPVVGWSSSVQMSDSADTRVVGLTARKTATQSIPTGTDTTITNWPGGYTDTHGSFDPTTGLYTVRTAGRFRVYGMLSWAAAANGFRIVVLSKSTGTILNSTYLPTSATALTYNQEVSWEGDLLAGESIRLRAFQNTGSALNIENTVTSAGSARLHVSSVSGPSAIAATETIKARYTSFSGNVVSTSPTLISFGTKTYDSHGSYSSGLFTCQSAGEFEVFAKVTSANLTLSTSQAFILYLYKNGSLFSELDVTFGDGAAHFHRISGGDTVPCIAGDTLAIYASSSVATTLDTSAASNFVTFKRIGI